MSVIGKITKLISKDNLKKTNGIHAVTATKDKFYPNFSTITPWSYYVVKPIVVDSETVIESVVVVQKNGSLQMTYAFRGQDIESFSYSYVAVIFEYFNSQIKRLGDGWMVSVEAQRFIMRDYPESDFDSVAALLVDKERAKEYRSTGEHYDSCYYLNFVYKPESEVKQGIVNKFYKETVKTLQIQKEIENFTKTIEQITNVLSGRLIIRPLNRYETVEYLHSTVSMTRHSFILPEDGGFLFLDKIINDSSLEVGSTLRLGEYYIPIIEINDFPIRTYPAILNELNKLTLEYRWVSRYFPLSKKQALDELVKYQQQAAGSKTSAKQFAGEFAMGIKDNLENHSGVATQNEAESAQEEIGGDTNGAGYYNSCVMVWDKDYTQALAKAREVQKVIEQNQFSCKEEIIGNFDAFRGMMAGNVTSDIRRPMITSGNFTHTLPFSAIWSGIEHNRFLGEICGIDKPLICCSTDYGANFYLNLNDGDVGHTIILGPTGAGKSTFLQLIEISALKYPDIQIFIMDYGLSCLTLTLAVGGTYINPADSTVCFQPFADIEDKLEFQWACTFVLDILALQGIKADPQMKVAVNGAMTAISVLPKEMRTFTAFCQNLEYVDKEGKRILHDALNQYRIEGRFGKIFDGNKTSLSTSRWVMFEMEKIMGLGEDCSAPALLFIFHYLEKSFTGRLTFFIMDECWFGLQNPAISGKMKEYLLTLRKKNVFCIFATQNPSMVAESSLGSVIIQNCPTHIFLADPAANEKGMRESYSALGLKDEEIVLLSFSKKKRDYYLKCPSGTRKFQLSLGPIELALFRGRESKIKLNGKIEKWENIQKYMLSIRQKEDGSYRAMVDFILDLQNVPYKQYLEGMEWKKWL